MELRPYHPAIFRILLPAATGVLCAWLPGGTKKKNSPPPVTAGPAPRQQLVKPEKYGTVKIWLNVLASQSRVEDLLTIMNQLPPGLDRNSAIRRIAYQWLPFDRKATMAWIESLPDAKEREIACGQMVRVWATHDPHAASAWVAALPEGPVKVATAVTLSLSVADFDPPAALSWAIAGREWDAPEGEENLNWMARWSGRNDPDASLEIIAASGLPADKKQSLSRLAVEDWNRTEAMRGHWDKIRPASSRPIRRP